MRLAHSNKVGYAISEYGDIARISDADKRYSYALSLITEDPSLKGLRESPMLIPEMPLDMTDSETNEKLLSALKKDSKFYRSISGVDICVSGNTLFTENSGLLTFFMQARERVIPSLGIVTTQEVSIWKHPSQNTSIATALFWDLFSVHSSIISDGIHSEAGKKFWERQLTAALGKDLSIYMINERDNDIREIGSVQQFSIYYKNDHSFSKYRIFITTNRIQEQYVTT